MKNSTLSIGVIVLAFAAYRVFEKRGAGGPAHTNVAIGEKAPDFTLSDSAGRPVRLLEVSKDNKVVLLNFWATWCAPCRMEMPELEKVYRKKKSAGLEILAVNQDVEAAELRAYIARSAITFPVLVDPAGDLGARYGVGAYPTSVFLDSEGRVLDVIEGLEPDLEGKIESLLRASPRR